MNLFKGFMEFIWLNDRSSVARDGVLSSAIDSRDYILFLSDIL